MNGHDLATYLDIEVVAHLDTELRDTKIDEGAVTEAQVVVVNRTGKPIPTPIAIVGIPGGLEVRHDQLKELVKAEKIAAYEVLGRDVVLYWRSLKPEQRVELPISLIAAIPIALAIGLVLGAVGALMVTLALQRLPFEAQTVSVASYLGAVLVLALVAASACFLPAWRATRVSPIDVLRQE